MVLRRGREGGGGVGCAGQFGEHFLVLVNFATFG